MSGGVCVCACPKSKGRNYYTPLKTPVAATTTSSGRYLVGTGLSVAGVGAWAPTQVGVNVPCQPTAVLGRYLAIFTTKTKPLRAGLVPFSSPCFLFRLFCLAQGSWAPRTAQCRVPPGPGGWWEVGANFAASIALLALSSAWM